MLTKEILATIVVASAAQSEVRLDVAQKNAETADEHLTDSFTDLGEFHDHLVSMLSNSTNQKETADDIVKRSEYVGQKDAQQWRENYQTLAHRTIRDTKRAKEALAAKGLDDEARFHKLSDADVILRTDFWDLHALAVKCSKSELAPVYNVMDEIHEMKEQISDHYHEKFDRAMYATKASLQSANKLLATAKQQLGEERAEHAHLHHEKWAEKMKLGAERLRDECGLQVEALTQKVWRDTSDARDAWENQNNHYKDARKAIYDKLSDDAADVLAQLKKEIAPLKKIHDAKKQKPKVTELE